MDVLIFNPHAGIIKYYGITAEQLLEKLEAKGIHATIPHYLTDDEMINVAAKAEGRIIVAGGDGTIHTILKAAGRCHAMKLAIIPSGTANHLAMALGIPISLDKAIDAIRNGHMRQIDLGKANGTIFSQAAGVGIHAKAFHVYGEHREKNRLDAAQAVVSTLMEWKPQLMRVEIDGEQYLEELTQVTAANTPVYGGRIKIAPDAKIDDGLFDVVIVKKLTNMEIIEYGLAAISGTLSQMPKTQIIRGKQIKVTSMGNEQVEVHADAEPIGYTPVTIEVLPGCLEVVVPQEEP